MTETKMIAGNVSKTVSISVFLLRPIIFIFPLLNLYKKRDFVSLSALLILPFDWKVSFTQEITLQNLLLNWKTFRANKKSFIPFLVYDSFVY